ncbi:sulfite exporter TauE/SafE family protein [Adhaeribacter rhizoryzae]|uniref:Probable membrane transporter protein n=1 Tax=Adhaeribacter rhizoryzae TaxID=2607907 RepID=A0A5M6DQM7_9BACT|nr:sulfite exporter TauE/SafE family protein [Adhaeribacter rhizoryzae]KAA5548552.1 sulfite exporter TauE/SafE family protein [Adhaeribacter rhizoryzae]
MTKENAGLIKSSEEQVTVITLPEPLPEVIKLGAAQERKKTSDFLFYLPALAVVIILAVIMLFKPFTGTLAGDFMAENITSVFLLYVLGGFLAQMVDGALGMAYGLTSTTFLLTIGVPPAAASASVHMSEIFTSGASGLMHLKLKNVNKKLFRLLLLPGVTGAILGAYILSSLETYSYLMKPLVAVYTLVLGVLIIIKAFKPRRKRLKSGRIAPLALFGGFMDSVGGGGWGPVVSSSLIAGGRSPRFAIGSVNLAEFFIAFASSLTFFAMIGISFWQIIAGLIVGGVIAAPIAANLSKRLPVKSLMILVGVIVILVSLRILFLAFLK